MFSCDRRLEKKIMHSIMLLITIIASLGVATGQIRQKTFRAMKIADSSLCVLDTPSQSLLVGKLQCSSKCSALTGCDYYNVIEQSEVNDSGTKTSCQLFINKPVNLYFKPFLLGKLRGCTAFENTAPICQSVVGSIGMMTTPLYCCNVVFTGQIDTQCSTTVYTGNGCSTLSSDKNGTCNPNIRGPPRILLQNKVPYGTGTVFFNTGWTSYVNGFGQPSLTDNYWIGNEKMYALTSGSTKYRLRIEILRTTGGWLYAEYESFVVGSSSTSYQLNVYGTCSGNAGDAIRVSNANANANSKGFGTSDRDSGSCVSTVGGYWNCANDFNSGWWWACCTASAINADGNGSWRPDGFNGGNDVIASKMYAQLI